MEQYGKAKVSRNEGYTVNIKNNHMHPVLGAVDCQKDNTRLSCNIPEQ